LFGNKYINIPPEILKRAAEKGTYMHQAIQNYEEKETKVDLEELDNYIKLKKEYKWKCVANEIPVILFIDNKPVACGRLDMVYKIGHKIGIMDFKRTSKLDKDYLFYQLNLYRIAYEQCYKKKVSELKGCHLRDKTHKIYEIQINEEVVIDYVREWLNGKMHNA
jgi:ATP-dependent exoDNAse (exonuclease V) beta subunit